MSDAQIHVLESITDRTAAQVRCLKLRFTYWTANLTGQLRRGIAHTVMITMGRKMTHFEAAIDPRTGVVDVSHTFMPNIVSPDADEHLVGQHEFDPHDDEMKIKDCVNLHIYERIPDKLSGKWTQMLIAEECLDLKKLMARSIELTEALAEHAAVSAKTMQTGEAVAESQGSVDQAARALFSDREHDFAARNNFCNTFALVTVLPCQGEVHHPARDPGHRHTMLVRLPQRTAFWCHLG